MNKILYQDEAGNLKYCTMIHCDYVQDYGYCDDERSYYDVYTVGIKKPLQIFEDNVIGEFDHE